jgi:glycosyltransferase involved in cell wall biosynthesis
MGAGTHARSAALLVCTYKRPQTFAKLIESVRALELPEGLAFSLVVADNNPQSAWDAYIAEAVADVPWPVHYGHEPEAGYSNARNKALSIASGVEGEILLFVDDDMILDPQWLKAHLRSHAEFGCDVVNGRIFGVRRRNPHGARLQQCGAGNVSFSRRLVAEAPEGLGLRFDAAYNKLGMEDQAFFRAAVARGADIRQSDHPLIYNYYGRQAVPEEEVINKMHTTASMQHNLVAKARADHGVALASLMASKGLVFGLKGLGQMCLARLQTLAGRTDKARQSELGSQKEFLKMKGRFAGLSGEIVSRQDVRRSDPAGKS